MSGDRVESGRAPIVLMLLLVAAAVLVWFALGGESERERVAGGVVEEAVGDSEHVELAGDADEEAARDAVEAAESGPGAGEAVGTRSNDGPRWRDLVEPIDAEGEIAPRDVLVHLARPGEVMVTTRLDARVPDDLLDGAIGVAAFVDVWHAPRFVAFDEVREVAAEVRAEGSGPREVGLKAGGHVHFWRQSASDAWRDAPIAYTVEPAGFEGEGPSGAAAVQAELFALMFGAFGRISKPSDPIDGDALRELLARDGASTVLDLDGVPFVEGLLFRAFEVRSDQQLSVHDLPHGARVRVRATSDASLELSTDKGKSWAASPSAPLTVDRRGGRSVGARVGDFARIVGSIAMPVHDAVVEMRFERERDGLWSITRYRCGPDDLGRFEFSGLSMGRYELHASWNDALEGRVTVARSVELAEGETYDLGVLSSAGTATVVLVPRLVVDGLEDPSLLGGDLPERIDWAAVLRTLGRTDASEAAWSTRVGARGLEPTTVRGVPPGSCTIHFETPDSSRFDGTGFFPLNWTEPDVIEVVGSIQVDCRLELRTSAALHVRVEIPSDAVGEASCRLSVHATSAVLDRAVRVVARPNRFDDAATIEPASASVWLPEGRWEITAVLAPRYHGAEVELSGWVGRASVVVQAGVETPTTVLLEKGATVVAAVGDLDPQDSGFGLLASVRPVGAPRLAEHMWRVEGQKPDDRVAIRGLLPDTTYEAPDTGLTFTTGGPGSVLELDAESGDAEDER